MAARKTTRQTEAAIAYRRVSTERQESEGWSLASQRTRMREYAAALDLDFIEEIEEAHSASEQGRPGFSRLLKLLRTSKAKVVIAEKLDRLSRNLRDLADLQDLVRDRDIEIHLVRDRKILSSDSSPSEWLAHDIEGAVARHFSRNLSLEVKKGMLARAKAGKFANGQPPFGYRLTGSRGELVLDPQEAPIVVAFFKRYSQGRWSLADIAAWADAKGYRSRRGRPWGTVTVQGLLRNRTYTGEAVMFRGEWFDAKHPAIIAPALWATVREVETRRSSGRGKIEERGYAHKRRSNERRPYSGILSCEACGHPVCFSPKRHRKTKAIQYHYWLCRNPACEHHVYTHEARIDDAIEDVLAAIQLPKDLASVAVKSAAAEGSGLGKEVERLSKGLKRNDTKQGQIVDELLEGRVSRAHLLARQERLVEEADRLRADLDRAEQALAHNHVALDAIADAVRLAQDLPELWRRGDVEARRELLGMLLLASGARSTWNPKAGVLKPAWKEPWRTIVSVSPGKPTRTSASTVTT